MALLDPCGMHQSCRRRLHHAQLRLMPTLLKSHLEHQTLRHRFNQKLQGEVGFASIQYDDQIGKLSLVGAGMRSHPGVTATFFGALSDAGVNIEMISTSEIRISIICRQADLERGAKAAHTAFELDADQSEAVVYGGTGR